jgi:hypothetical protein
VLLDPPGHGICPTAFHAGATQLVLNVASQHGGSTNIEASVRPATSSAELFAPISSLPDRDWQTALQATAHSSEQDPLPFVPSHFHEQKTNDAPVMGE